MTFPFDPPKVENITVFTDASFEERDMSAGGAFWAKGGSEGGTKKSGSFGITEATCSGTAECIASLKSIFFLLEDPQFHDLLRAKPSRLILVTDCQGVQQMLDRRQSAYMRNHVVNDLCQDFWKAQTDLGFYFKCNWVKAHSSGKTARGWVNNWCDQQAKQARLKVRKMRIDNELREAHRNPEAYINDMAAFEPASHTPQIDQRMPWE